MRPLVAIVGRPNVGKSTLYNRLVGGRPAIVHDTPGVTRDRRYGDVDYFGRRFRLVDTGGLDPKAEREAIGAGIHRQAQAAIDESQLVLFVVDGRAGVHPLDRDVAVKLRRCGRPVLLVVNKIDSPKRDDLTAEFFELGLGEPRAISAEHGRGVDELVEEVVERLGLEEEGEEEEAGEGEEADRPLRIAFVGKPNAGKSSLVNRLVGSERSLVHDVPGTTTDPVDSPFEFGGRRYVLVDTAGIRRKARIEADTEKLSVTMALGQIERADVAVLVVDAAAGPSEQDARLAGAIEERGAALVVALNKSDLLEPGRAARLRGELRDQLHFLSYAPSVMVSALRGDGVADLLREVDRVAAEHARRIPTAELNRFFQEVCEEHPPPTHSGRTVRIHYITQGGVRPPTFLLWANRPRDVTPAYRRFLANQLRSRYGFRGTPIRVIAKAKVSGKGREHRPKRRRRR